MTSKIPELLSTKAKPTSVKCRPFFLNIYHILPFPFIISDVLLSKKMALKYLKIAETHLPESTMACLLDIHILTRSSHSLSRVWPHLLKQVWEWPLSNRTINANANLSIIFISQLPVSQLQGLKWTLVEPFFRILALNSDPLEQSQVPKSHNVPKMGSAFGELISPWKMIAIKLSLSILLSQKMLSDWPALSEWISRHVYCTLRQVLVSNCLSLNERAVRAGWVVFLWVSERGEGESLVGCNGLEMSSKLGMAVLCTLPGGHMSDTYLNTDPRVGFM